MQLDKKAVNKLLSLDDRQLKSVIEKVVSESGIDLSDFNASENDIASVRRALMSVTDEDLARISEQYNSYKKSSRRKR